MIRLAFGANNMPSAYRASFRHVKELVPARMVLVFDHPIDFGDDVAAALDFYPVANLHSQALDFVHVVESGAADGSSPDGDRFQRRNRREFSGASDLYQDVLDLCDSSTSCVFVGDGPARGFAGVAELSLQNSAIHLDDDAVDFVGKGFSIGFFLCNEGPDLVEALGRRAGWVDLEASRVQRVKRLPMTVKKSTSILQEGI